MYDWRGYGKAKGKYSVRKVKGGRYVKIDKQRHRIVSNTKAKPSKT